MALSRVEQILENALGANHELQEPQSRIEALLMQYFEQAGSSPNIVVCTEADMPEQPEQSTLYVVVESE